jgi:hypothetical protein
MKTAVAFLTTSPQDNTIKFAEEISKVGFDVFIICDNYYPTIEKTDNSIEFIYIEDETCIKMNYVNSNISSTSTHIKKNPIAWDKFLLFFCEFAPEYDFVWVFEDDCFMESVNVIQNIHLNYSSFDLVTPNNFKNDGKAMDWHWREIYPKISGPYAYSMVCAAGMSRKLLNSVQDYKNNNQSLFYTEVMFNTLALKNNLKVKDAFELKSIVWQGEWGINEFLLLPNNVFHPRKDIEQHYELRNMIKHNRFLQIKPKNNLPYFLFKNNIQN